jgi:hypothetical protein
LGLGCLSQGTNCLLRRGELLLPKRGLGQTYEGNAKQNAANYCHNSNTLLNQCQ